MIMRSRLAGLLFVASIALLAGPAAPSGAAPTAPSGAAPTAPSPQGSGPRAVTGTVVHTTKRTAGFVVADHLGRLVAVHSARPLSPGLQVRLDVRRLSNGTYAAGAVRTLSTRRRAGLRGRVTYIAPSRSALVVSARGVSVLVRLRSGARARRALAAGAAASGIGASVVVDAELGSASTVTARDLRVLGHSTRPVDLEGVLETVSDRVLQISADDAGVSGASLTVHLPPGFDVSTLSAGDEVQLVARPEPDGSYTAIGASGDSSQQQADDSGAQQGDDGSCDPAADPACAGDGSCDPTADPSCADAGCDVSVDPTCTDGADPGPAVVCDPASDPTCLTGDGGPSSAPAGGPGGPGGVTPGRGATGPGGGTGAGGATGGDAPPPGSAGSPPVSDGPGVPAGAIQPSPPDGSGGSGGMVTSTAGAGT